MRRLVTTSAEIRFSGHAFVRALRDDPDVARDLIRRSWYWVYDPENESFYPSKFVAYAEMDARRYRMAITASEPGARFHGALAARTLEQVLDSKFVEIPLRTEQMKAWAQGRIPEVFQGIDCTGWQFVEFPVVDQPERARKSWGEWDKPWSNYQTNFDDRDRLIADAFAARPGHAVRDQVVTKIELVSGLWGNTCREDPRTALLADLLVRDAKRVDACMHQLRAISGGDATLNAESLKLVADIHGEMLLLFGLAMDQTHGLVGWVSRYLAGHAPGVPVFDPPAASTLAKWYSLKWAKHQYFIAGPKSSPEYAQFLKRFAALWENAEADGIPTGVRFLSWYVRWNVW